MKVVSDFVVFIIIAVFLVIGALIDEAIRFIVRKVKRKK